MAGSSTVSLSAMKVNIVNGIAMPYWALNFFMQNCIIDGPSNFALRVKCSVPGMETRVVSSSAVRSPSKVASSSVQLSGRSVMVPFNTNSPSANISVGSRANNVIRNFFMSVCYNVNVLFLVGSDIVCHHAEYAFRYE